MNSKPLYMESTEIPAQRTTYQILELFRQPGQARAARSPARHFVLTVGDLPYRFALAARTEAVQKIFKQRRVKTMGFQAYEFGERDRSRPSV